jgi:hypothetical protein
MVGRIEHVLELKLAAGRHRDLDDVRALRALSEDGTDGGQNL